MKKLIIILSLFTLVFTSCSTGSGSPTTTDTNTTNQPTNSSPTNNTPTNSGTTTSNNQTGQIYQNNATDTMFRVSGNNNAVDVSSLNWLNGYIRSGTGTGLIGTWSRSYDINYSNQREETLTFNVNGTWSCVTNYVKRNEINRSNGTYEVYINNGQFYIRVFWSTREYNLKYVVSNSYLCHETSGCPI